MLLVVIHQETTEVILAQEVLLVAILLRQEVVRLEATTALVEALVVQEDKINPTFSIDFN